MTSRMGSGDGHLLIGGPGRSGTTLLVQYFTALGFDTGFTLDQAKQRVDALSFGGLEHSLKGSSKLPYVAKSPYFGHRLGDYLDRGAIDVIACIVPVRDLFAAAESRRRVSREAEKLTGQSAHPGGLAFKSFDNPRRQEQKIAVQQYKLVRALARHGIPVYLPPFPEFVTDPHQLYRSMRPLLMDHGVSETESEAALVAVSIPERVHDFSEEN